MPRIPIEESGERRIMELLAPAGSMAHLLAAVSAGADAVYLGGKSFSARRYADNFSDDELREAVRICHIFGVSVFITVNTLTGDREMEDMETYLRFLGTLPVDGLIMQDIGAARLASRVVPELPLHASTQMTVTNLADAEFLKELHFTRIVLARELPMEEIAAIAGGTDQEIEVFCHGALCVCYSGQCLMSSFIGGRSGNRGACAQPCRLPYVLTDQNGCELSKNDGKYLLSLKDMISLDRMREFMTAGVKSLKIEGRMKSPDYVYRVVSAYRTAMDAVSKGQNIDTEKLRMPLDELFSRGYTQAYTDGRPGPDMISRYSPNNHGQYIGRIHAAGKNEFLIHSDRVLDFSGAEGIQYVTEKGDMIFVPAEKLPAAGKDRRFSLRGAAAPRTDSPVYLQLRQPVSSFTVRDFAGKIPVRMEVRVREGEPVILNISDEAGNHACAVSSFKAEKAVHEVTGAQEVRQQTERLGNTFFTLSETTVENRDACFVPRSILNGLRTEAVKQLENVRIRDFLERQKNSRQPSAEPGVGKISCRKEHAGPILSATVSTMEQAEEAIRGGADQITVAGETFTHRHMTLQQYEEILDICRKHDRTVVFSTPRLVKEKDEAACRNRLLHLADMEPDEMEIHFFGALLWLREEEKEISVEGGFSLNIFNSYSASALEQAGFSGFMASPELTIRQLRHLAGHTPLAVGAYVYGRTEMMISEYCVINAVMAGCSKDRCPVPCMKHEYFLKDRLGKRFPVKTDAWCHMHILNAQMLDARPYIPQLTEAGIRKFQIDGRTADGNLEKICASFRGILDGKEAPPSPESSGNTVTRGHFIKGVL